jgi:ribosomal protein S18 acetylase RimI-like enzyme
MTNPPPPTFEVRWLAVGDEALAAQAMHDVLDDEPRGFDDGWLADPRVHFVVALVEGTPVAVAYGHTLPLPDGRIEMLLYSLDVIEAYRRLGMGRALVTAFLERTRALGFDELWVLTDPENEAANATYRSVGPPSGRETSVMYTWDASGPPGAPADG